MPRLTNLLLVGTAVVLQSSWVSANQQVVGNQILDAVTDYVLNNKWIDATTNSFFLVDSRITSTGGDTQNRLSRSHDASLLSTKAPDKIKVLGADSAAACFTAVNKCSAGRNILLQLGASSLRGDTTVVRVTVQSVANGASLEIHAKSATMHLLRKANAWSVVKVTSIASS